MSDVNNMSPLKGEAMVVAVAAGSSFFLFGYDTGIVSTALTWCKRSLHLSGVEYEVAVAVTTLVAGLAALGARTTNSWIGRRGTVLVAGVLFFVGAVGVASANGFALLVAGRACIGGGCGLATMSVPIYIAEVAPAELRGTLLSMEVFFTVFGQAVAGAINGALASANKPWWRLSMGIAALPSLFVFGVFCVLPESPRWLLQHGDDAAAERVLARLTRTSDVRREVAALRAAIGLDQELALADLWGYSSQLRRAMALGVFLMMLQQLAGINTIMYYSTIVLLRMGFSETTAAWLTCICAAAQGIGVFITVRGRLPDVYGRRRILLASTTAVALALALFALTFHRAPYIALAALFAYLVAFGIGLAPLPWVRIVPCPLISTNRAGD